MPLSELDHGTAGRETPRSGSNHETKIVGSVRDLDRDHVAAAAAEISENEVGVLKVKSEKNGDVSDPILRKPQKQKDQVKEPIIQRDQNVRDEPHENNDQSSKPEPKKKENVAAMKREVDSPKKAHFNQCSLQDIVVVEEVIESVNGFKQEKHASIPEQVDLKHEHQIHQQSVMVSELRSEVNETNDPPHSDANASMIGPNNITKDPTNWLEQDSVYDLDFSDLEINDEQPTSDSNAAMSKQNDLINDQCHQDSLLDLDSNGGFSETDDEAPIPDSLSKDICDQKNEKRKLESPTDLQKSKRQKKVSIIGIFERFALSRPFSLDFYY